MFGCFRCVLVELVCGLCYRNPLEIIPGPVEITPGQCQWCKPLCATGCVIVIYVGDGLAQSWLRVPALLCHIHCRPGLVFLVASLPCKC